MTVTRVFGEDVDNQGGGDEIKFDYGAIFISSCAELVGTFLVVAIVDRVGRIPTQVFSYVIGGLSLFFLCFWADFGCFGPYCVYFKPCAAGSVFPHDSPP